MKRKLKAFNRRHYQTIVFIRYLLVFALGFGLGYLTARSMPKIALENRGILRVSEKTGSKTSLEKKPCLVGQNMTDEIEKESREIYLSGEASYYSENGCIGCSATLTMANGERLDDDNFTVALPLNYLNLLRNQFVKVKNLANNQVVEAKVTDTGGFDKLGRVADLSLATKNAIGCAGLCQVLIYK